MMKRWLLIIALFLIIPSIASAGGYMGIVDRTATRDTISLPLAFLDSLGNNVTGAAGDSVYIFVNSPGGTEVHRDSGLLAVLTAVAPQDHPSMYVWTNQISVLDGSSTALGLFTYSILAVDISLALRTYSNGSFQIIDETLDGQFALLGTLANQVIIIDSLYAALDSIQAYLDATISSRSTLVASDNIGINWGDVSNPTTVVDLTNTTFEDILAGITLVDDIWDELLTGATHNINSSSGKILRQLKEGVILHDGVSDNVPANAANSFSFESGGGTPTSSTIDDFYNHQRITIAEGTGAGQVVIISDYIGATQVATVTPAFLTIPDATSVYEITPGIVHTETQGGGYALGAVWVGPSGSTGTQLFVDGTIDNPIDDGSFANAKTVADALGLTIFQIGTASTITLATTYNNYDFNGVGWHIALGGQDLGHSNICGAEVSGIATGSDPIQFFDCSISDIEITPSNYFNCGFDTNPGLFLATAAGQYIFRNCYSLISGTLTPQFSMGDLVGNTKFGFREYYGGIELSEIGSAGEDSISIEGFGNIVLNSSNIGGDMVIRGLFTLTDNSATTTITRDAALNGEYLTDLNWDEVLSAGTHNVTNSSGRRLRQLADVGVIRAATAQAGSSNTITLDASASSVDGMYDPSSIYITGGTGAGQTRNILEYDGAGKVAWVDRNWKTIPDATSEFTIIPDAGREHVNEGRAQGGTASTIILNTLASSDDDAYNGQNVFIRSGIGEDQVRNVIDYNGTTKVATINERNWDVVPTDSSVYVMLPTGSFDRALYARQVADSTWDADTSLHNVAETFAVMLKDTSAYQGAAAGVDSTLISNLLHRIVWGTAVGSGSDSSTLAQRDATIAAIVNDVITAASIATNAIGASEIAANAIGADEIAASAINVSEAPNLDAAISTRGTLANQTDLIASMDSLFMMLGYEIGAQTFSRYSANADTLYITSAAGDTIRRLIYDHPSGSSGQAPDTVTTITGP